MTDSLPLQGPIRLVDVMDRLAECDRRSRHYSATFGTRCVTAHYGAWCWLAAWVLGDTATRSIAPETLDDAMRWSIARVQGVGFGALPHALEADR